MIYNAHFSVKKSSLQHYMVADWIGLRIRVQTLGYSDSDFLNFKFFADTRFVDNIFCIMYRTYNET